MADGISMSTTDGVSGDSRCQSPSGADGLPSKIPLPEVLALNLVDQHLVCLGNEWRPSTPTEEVLVRELARHQAVFLIA